MDSRRPSVTDVWCPAEGDMPEFLREELGNDDDETDIEDEGLLVEELGDRLEQDDQLDVDVGANVTVSSQGLLPALEVPKLESSPPPDSPSVVSYWDLFTNVVPEQPKLDFLNPYPGRSRPEEASSSFVTPARATVLGQGVPGGSSLPYKDDPSSSSEVPAAPVLRRASSCSSEELEDAMSPLEVPIFGAIQAVDASLSEVEDPAVSIDVDREDHLDELAVTRERERDAREDADWMDVEGMGVNTGLVRGGDDEGMDEERAGLCDVGARHEVAFMVAGLHVDVHAVLCVDVDAVACVVPDSRAGVPWVKGNRLIQHYRTDEDVPPMLREKLEFLVHEREARQRATRARNERLDEERDRNRSAHRRNDDDDDDNGDDDANDENVRRLYQDFKRFSRDEQSAKFVWMSMESFGGAREAFLVEKTGPTQHFDDAYQAFRAVWTDDILEHIVLETNRYASTIPETDRNFHANWYPTNVHEMLLLFAFWIMLGLIQMPTIDSCFSLHPLLRTHMFRKLFTRQRYWALNKALHFANPISGDSDKLKLIRPVLEHLNKKFQELYVPLRNICIDESLTLWKGLLKFKQYIKTKAAKFGLKTYELCDSATGYLIAFFVYTGKEATEDVSKQQSSKHVLKLIHPYVQKGYTLFMDNYFNSPLLARYLKRNKTDVVGTLRKSRNDVPPLLSERLKDGHYIARHADNVVVMSFGDKKSVSVISTYHNDDQHATVAKPGKPSKYKLDLEHDYNASMGGVDQKDAMLQPHLIERKQSVKWYKKLFKRLLNVSVQNSRILTEQSKKVKLNATGFRLQLVGAIADKHRVHKPQPPRGGSGRATFLTGLNPFRYVCEPNRFHSVVKTKGNDPTAPRSRNSNSLNKRRCVYCLRVNHCEKRTVYECGLCKQPLCMEPCFALYHTQQR